jgi:hypothetical protein
LKIEPLRLALETSLFARLAEGQEERKECHERPL